MSTRVSGVVRFFDNCAGSFSLLAAGLCVISAPAFVFLMMEDHRDKQRALVNADEAAKIYRGSVEFTADDWNDFSRAIRDPNHWRNKSRETGRSRASLQKASLGGDRLLSTWRPGTRRSRSQPNSPSGSYRTVCVRLCDGYFWPISFSAGRGQLRADEKACASSCGVESKLFYYSSSGQEPADMVDLRGRPYARLRTAFRYTQQYVANCKCRPDPWETAARERHAYYAELQQTGRLKRFLAKLDRKSRHGRGGYDSGNETRVVSLGGGLSVASGAASSVTTNSTRNSRSISANVRSVTRMGLGATATSTRVTRRVQRTTRRSTRRRSRSGLNSEAFRRAAER